MNLTYPNPFFSTLLPIFPISQPSPLIHRTLRCIAEKIKKPSRYFWKASQEFLEGFAIKSIGWSHLPTVSATYWLPFLVST